MRISVDKGGGMWGYQWIQRWYVGYQWIRGGGMWGYQWIQRWYVGISVDKGVVVCGDISG